MNFSALDETRQRIENAPRAGQSLLLYALVKTLTTQRGGHPFLLTKLKEMDPDTRRVAYGLMELMACGGCACGEWNEAVGRMDDAMRR